MLALLTSVAALAIAVGALVIATRAARRPRPDTFLGGPPTSAPADERAPHQM